MKLKTIRSKIFFHASSIVVLIIMISFLCAISVSAQPLVWGVKGNISQINFDGNKGYIVGKFDKVGPVLGALASFNLTTNQWEEGIEPKIPSWVSGVAEDKHGRMYVIGYFYTTDREGVGYSKLVRLLPNGAIDKSFRPYIFAFVSLMYSDDSNLYVLGDIDYIRDEITGHAECRQGGFALDLENGELLPWNPRLFDFNHNSCRAIADMPQISKAIVHKDTVFIQGSFTTVQGVSRDGIVEVDKNNGDVTPFRISSPLPLKSIIHTASSNGGLFASIPTEYDQFQNVLKFKLAELSVPNGAIVRASPIFDGSNLGVTVARVGNDLIVGGSFTKYNNLQGPGLIKLSEGSFEIDSQFQPPSNIHAGSTIADLSRNRLYTSDGILNLTTGELVSSATKPSVYGDYGADYSSYNGMALINDKLMFYSQWGGFISPRLTRNQLAEIDLTTGEVSSFQRSSHQNDQEIANYGFNKLASNSQALYTLSGNKLYKIDKNTGLVELIVSNLPYQVTGSSLVGIRTLGDELYLFSQSALVKVNLQSKTSYSVSLSLAGSSAGQPYLQDVQISNGKIYLSGFFTSVNNISRQNVAVLNSSTYAVQPLSLSFTKNPSMQRSSVDSMLVDQGTLYLGGNFASVNGQVRLNLAAVDTTSGTLLPFTVTTGNIYDSTIAMSFVKVSDGILVGLESPSVSPVIKVDPVSGALLPFPINRLLLRTSNSKIRDIGQALANPQGPGDVFFAGYSVYYGHLVAGPPFAALPNSGVVAMDGYAKPTPTRLPTSTPQPTPTPGYTRTPWPTVTPIATSTDTPSPTRTATSSPTVTISPTLTSTLTATVSAIPSNSPTVTPTDTPETIATSTAVPATPTATPALDNQFPALRVSCVKGTLYKIKIPKISGANMFIVTFSHNKGKKFTIQAKGSFTTKLDIGSYLVTYKAYLKKAKNKVFIGQGLPATIVIKK